MVQSLARCRVCGLPSKLAEGLEWSPGGIILLRCAKPLRLVLLDEGTSRAIQQALEERLTWGACLIAETDAVRAAVSGVLTGLKDRLSRYGAFKKKTLEALEEHSLLLGLGRMELEKYTPGQGGAMLLRRPFVLGMTTAVMAGVLGEMEHCSHESTLQDVGENDFRLVLEAAEPGENQTHRPGDEDMRMVAGAYGEYRSRCRQCGLPAQVTGLRWDELYGSIQAGTGGRRVALLPACLLDAFAYLEGGGQGEREGIVQDAVFRTTRAVLQGGSSDAYEGVDLLPVENAAGALRDNAAMRGWGDVNMASLNGGDWRIEVVNPIDDALIAGWLRAIYTVAVGREPRLSVDGEPPLRVFQLSS